ncbi:alpha/beta fold hydrolase [Nonomuraea sp. JJY05]|uniref:alpha/beta fold hydrolase n=1 Tax=Nonomuraea sp. JJY05 TaxID=3350255 RepID=UPI00373FB57A
MTGTFVQDTGAHRRRQWAHDYVPGARWSRCFDDAGTAFSRSGYEVTQAVVDDARGMTYHALVATTQTGDDYVKQRALPDRLVPLGKPLLVIFGEEDRRRRFSSAADYRAVPGAKVELLPGVGHSPVMEDPPRTASHTPRG